MVSAVILGKLPSKENAKTLFFQFLYQGLPQTSPIWVSLSPVPRAGAGSEALAARARARSEVFAARTATVFSATLLTAFTVQHAHALPVAHPTYRRTIFACPPAVCFIFSFFTPRSRRKKRLRQLPLKGSWRGLPEALHCTYRYIGQ